MVGICIRVLRILFEWLELAFECFECCSNGWNWQSNASNAIRLFASGTRMLQILFEWLELAFECLESCSNGWNLHLNSSPVWMVGICIQMIWIPFKWLELAFECFESHSNGWNLHSGASNPIPMVRIPVGMLGIAIQVLPIWFEWLLRIPVKWFKSCLNASKLFSTAWNSNSNAWNWHSNASNPIQMVGIGIWVLRMLFE